MPIKLKIEMLAAIIASPEAKWSHLLSNWSQFKSAEVFHLAGPKHNGTAHVLALRAHFDELLGAGDQVVHQETVPVVRLWWVVPSMDQLVEVHGAVCPVNLLLEGAGSAIRVKLNAVAVLDSGQERDGAAAGGRRAIGTGQLGKRINGINGTLLVTL
jgi:hypothetical protein